MRLKIRGFWRSESGAALAETAIVLPVALILLAGVIEIGRALYSYQAAEEAVRGAARHIARLAPGDSAGIQRAIATAEADLALTGGTVDVSIVGAAPTATSAKVLVQANVELTFYMLNVVGIDAFVIQAEHEEATIFQ